MKDKALRDHWEERVRLRLDAISNILVDVSLSGMKFSNLTSLAKYIAKQLSESDTGGRSVNKSTILRNPLYRAALLKHFNQKNPLNDGKAEQLRVELACRELSIENRRIKEEIASILKDRSQIEGKLKGVMVHNHDQKLLASCHASWFHLFNKVVDQIEGAYLDIDSRELVDPHGVGIIATENDFPPSFFEWLNTSKR